MRRAASTTCSASVRVHFLVETAPVNRTKRAIERRWPDYGESRGVGADGEHRAPRTRVRSTPGRCWSSSLDPAARMNELRRARRYRYPGPSRDRPTLSRSVLISVCSTWCPEKSRSRYRAEPRLHLGHLPSQPGIALRSRWRSRRERAWLTQVAGQQEDALDGSSSSALPSRALWRCRARRFFDIVLIEH